MYTAYDYKRKKQLCEKQRKIITSLVLTLLAMLIVLCLELASVQTNTRDSFEYYKGMCRALEQRDSLQHKVSVLECELEYERIK